MENPRSILIKSSVNITTKNAAMLAISKITLQLHTADEIWKVIITT